MNFLAETRLQNMKNLVEEAGSVAELAKRAGYAQPSYLYQIINQTAIQNGKPKNIGGALARKLEAAMNKAEGWLDMNHGETLPLPPEDTETIRIDHLDMAGACGGGIEADDWPSPISSVEFPLDAVRRLFSGRDTSGLKIVGTRGDSMEPTIPETSAVLIDTKADTFAGDGIYFFAYAGGLYTKRLQKTPTGLLALSDNPLYQSFPIDENDRFRIIGRYYGVISLKLAQ